VDGYVFFHLRRMYRERYNPQRQEARARIEARPGLQPCQKGGHIWWEGADLTEGGSQRYTEDLTAPIKDLHAARPVASACNPAFTGAGD
jgi:hypothetical protein